MKHAIKKLWVEALESGKYKQGTGCLRKGNSFCCLGVLCDLCRKEKGLKWKRSSKWSNWYFFNEESFLPFEVQKWAGLDSSNPDVEFDGDTFRLSNLNDDGHDFKEIAKAIRENL